MEQNNFTTNELIGLALAAADDEARWDYVRVLHEKGNKEVFDAARQLCESGDPKKITLGADILGQLGTTGLPFKNESVPLLLKTADANLESVATETGISAPQSIVFALGRMVDQNARDKILQFVSHPSEDIRFAVACGILFAEKKSEIEALIKLSNDSDEDVRNWATFGLGRGVSRFAGD